MKPIWTFLYILITMIIFVMVSYFMPYSQIEQTVISDDLHDSISVSPESVAIDSFVIANIDTAIISGTGELETKNKFQFFESGPKVFYPFFEKLKNLHAYNAPLRILYYGDSQLENDRITASVRRQLQATFGGKGVGLLPLDLTYNLSHQFSIDLSDNWQRISIHDKNTKHPISSLVFKNTFLNGKQSGWLKIKQIKNRKHEHDYSQVKLYYQSKGEFIVSVNEGGQLIYKGKVAKTEKLKALNFNFDSTPESVEFYFETTDTLNISGISLESPSGILVDNIALRGFSYPTFTKLNASKIRENIQLINPGLCVFQFGVNLAPYFQKEYTHYQKQLVKQIRKFQQLVPNVPVLIVGISDMAKKENGKMISYPNIKTIKKAQIEAAKECNCAFWDLEKFMGGEGSMVKWANANPRLGQKDYIHFTEKGTEMIGNELSKLLLDEYNSYKNNNFIE